MWLPILGSLLVSVAVSVIFRPKTPVPKAAGLDQFSVPTAEVGREIPVVFGTCDISGPNCVWYGDLRNEPIRK